MNTPALMPLTTRRAKPASRPPAPLTGLLPAEVTARRLAACQVCPWNMGNRCEHPSQLCAPCRQGVGLTRALADEAFLCPDSRF